jgi:hypothetical protein
MIVAFAFVAGLLSLAVAAAVFMRRGEIAATPLFGGLFMLALGIGGFVKLKDQV